MPKQRRMNKQARLELVRSYREEYMSAGRSRRGEILSCLQGSTNYNRKYLIRLLRGKYKHHARRKQRGRHYGAALDDVLRVSIPTCTVSATGYAKMSPGSCVAGHAPTPTAPPDLCPD